MSSIANSAPATANSNLEEFLPSSRAAEICENASPASRDWKRRNAVCLDRSDMKAWLNGMKLQEEEAVGNEPADQEKDNKEHDEWILKEKGYDVQMLIEGKVPLGEGEECGEDDEHGLDEEYEVQRDEIEMREMKKAVPFASRGEH